MTWANAIALPLLLSCAVVCAVESGPLKPQPADKVQQEMDKLLDEALADCKLVKKKPARPMLISRAVKKPAAAASAASTPSSAPKPKPRPKKATTTVVNEPPAQPDEYEYDCPPIKRVPVLTGIVPFVPDEGEFSPVPSVPELALLMPPPYVPTAIPDVPTCDCFSEPSPPIVISYGPPGIILAPVPVPGPPIYVHTPAVPEPAPFALLGAGLLLLIWRKR